MSFLNSYLPVYETPFLQPTYLRKYRILLIGMHYCIQIILMHFFLLLKAVFMEYPIGY